MPIAGEACEAGVVGQGLKASGTLLISAASAVENSLSASYDPSEQTRLADEFSYQLWRAESRVGRGRRPPGTRCQRLDEHRLAPVHGASSLVVITSGSSSPALLVAAFPTVNTYNCQHVYPTGYFAGARTWEQARGPATCPRSSGKDRGAASLTDTDSSAVPLANLGASTCSGR